MKEFLFKFPALCFVAFIFFLGFILDIVLVGIKGRRREGPSPISKIANTVLNDSLSLISFLILGTLIILLIAKSEIPEILRYLSATIVGYHIARIVPKKNFRDKDIAK